MDLDERIVAIGFAGEQRLDLVCICAFSQFLQTCQSVLDDIIIAFGFTLLSYMAFALVRETPAAPMERGNSRGLLENLAHPLACPE